MQAPVSRLSLLPAWLEYGVLLLLYFAFRLPDVLVVESFFQIIFPLNFLYFGKLLFSGWSVNPEIANTVIAPANASLIYPPGIYMLGNVLGSVRNCLYFLLVIQAAVPLLTYALLRMRAPRLFAFPIALLVAWHGTSARSWYPDYIIQPLLLAVLYLLLSRSTRDHLALRLVACGLLAGLVILFKHNIGIFFGILCGTVLLLQSVCDGATTPRTRAIGYALLAAMVVFGLAFWARLPHWDEAIFYLLPFFAFWGLVINAYRQSKVYFDLPRFATGAASFGIAAAALPVAVFLWFGSIIGYARYAYSLFGMGFDHIGFWDPGIVEILRNHANFSSFDRAYVSAILLFALGGPFVINLVGVARLSNLGREFLQEKNQMITVAIGVMAIFMLFPLEDQKIAVSKASVFLVAITFLGVTMRPTHWKRLTYVAMVVLVPVAWLCGRTGYKAANSVWASGGPILQKAVGIPMQPQIARELDRQTDILIRSTHGKPYYVITSPAFNLVTLMGLVANPVEQYYVRFDTQALNAAVVDAVIDQLAKTPYVVLSDDDYAAFGKDALRFKGWGRLIDYIVDNFEPVDRYLPATGLSVSARHIDAFVVLKRRGS